MPKCENCGSELTQAFTKNGFIIYICPHAKVKTKRFENSTREYAQIPCEPKPTTETKSSI